MRIWAQVATAVLAIGLLGPAGPSTAAGDCVLSGRVTDANLAGLGTGAYCRNGPASLIGRWWLAPQGSDWGFDYEETGGLGWTVYAAGEVLPQSMRCNTDVELGNAQIGSGQPVLFTSLGPRLWTYGFEQVNAGNLDNALASPHSGTASVNIECPEIGSARWTMPYTVLPASPPGRELGVSINDGDDFTNNPEVGLHLGWKTTTSQVKVSNDGGFAPSKTRVFDLSSAEPLRWRLVVLGNERLPRTVYVRFKSYDGNWETITYTDDIVLDTVVPHILSATLVPPDPISLTASRRTLRVTAKDNRSGVKSIQISKGKPRKKAKVVRFRKAVAAPGSGRLFVRVRDGAGNWSKWRAVA